MTLNSIVSIVWRWQLLNRRTWCESASTVRVNCSIIYQKSFLPRHPDNEHDCLSYDARKLRKYSDPLYFLSQVSLLYAYDIKTYHFYSQNFYIDCSSHARGDRLVNYDFFSCFVWLISFRLSIMQFNFSLIFSNKYHMFLHLCSYTCTHLYTRILYDIYLISISANYVGWKKN